MSEPKIAVFTSLIDFNNDNFKVLCEFTKVMLKTFFETQRDYKYDFYICIPDGKFIKWIENLYPYSRTIKFIKGYCPDDLDRYLKPWWNKIFTSVELLKQYDIVIHIDYDTIVFNSFKNKIIDLHNSDHDTYTHVGTLILDNIKYFKFDTALIMFHKRSLEKFKYIQIECKEFIKKYYKYPSEEIYLGQKQDLKNNILYITDFNDVNINDLTYIELYSLYKNGLAYHINNSHILRNDDEFMPELTANEYVIKSVLTSYFLMKDYFSREFVNTQLNKKIQAIKNYKIRETNDHWNESILKILLEELNKSECSA